MALTRPQGRGQRGKAEGQVTLTVRGPTSSWAAPPYAYGGYYQLLENSYSPSPPLIHQTDKWGFTTYSTVLILHTQAVLILLLILHTHIQISTTAYEHMYSSSTNTPGIQALQLSKVGIANQLGNPAARRSCAPCSPAASHLAHGGPVVPARQHEGLMLYTCTLLRALEQLDLCPHTLPPLLQLLPLLRKPGSHEGQKHLEGGKGRVRVCVCVHVHAYACVASHLHVCVCARWCLTCSSEGWLTE